MQVSLEYLNNVKREIRRSAKAWRERYLLERMRQGRFQNREEAFKNGWLELKVTVIGSRLGFSGISDETTESGIRSLFSSKSVKERFFLLDHAVIDRCASTRIRTRTSSDVDIATADAAMRSKSNRFSRMHITSFSAASSSYVDVFVEAR